MSYQPQLRKIIREISNESNVEYDKVEKAVNSMFEFLKNAMGEGDFEDPDSFKNVQVMHLGKFVVKPGRVEYINKMKENGRKNKSNS